MVDTGTTVDRVLPTTFASMRQPKYQLRMDADLLRRLTEAGTTRVREALEQAFPVVPGTTQATEPVVPAGNVGTTHPPKEAKPVLPKEGTGTTAAPKAVVPPKDAGTTGAVAVVPGMVKPPPPWAAKLEVQRAEMEAQKRERDRLRAEGKAVPL